MSLFPFRKAKTKAPAPVTSDDPVDRMRYALDPTATTSRSQEQENGTETEDPLEKIRSAGY